MTTKLFILNQPADFFDDEAIIFTQSLKNVQELDGTFGAFTRQFSIPASPTNDSILSHYSRMDVDGLDPHSRIESYLLINNLQQIDGFIEVNGVTYKDLKPDAYKVTFYANQTNIKLDIGNTKLADVDWSSLYTDLTYANVKASWIASDPDVLFPVIGSSRDWLYMDTTAHADNIRLSTTGILLEELKPAFKLKTFIELMLADVKTVTWGTNIDAFLDKTYIQPSASAGALKIPTDYNFHVWDSFTATSSLPIIFTNLKINNSGAYNVSTGNYTIPADGTYIFSYNWTMALAVPSTYEATIRVNDTAMVSYSGTDKIESLSYEAAFSQGDEVEIRHTSAISQTVTRGTFKLTFYPTNYVGETIVFAFPDILVVDFLKMFLDSYNLLITNDGLIIDFDSYYSGIVDITQYTNRDFTADKLDMPAEFKLMHKESEAFNYTEFDNYAQRKFGDINVINDVVNPSGSISKDSPFTVFPPAYLDWLNSAAVKYDVTDLLLPKQIDATGKAINNDFLIFNYNGTESIDNYYYLQDSYTTGVATFTQQTTLPIVSMDYGSNSLTYSNEHTRVGSIASNTITEAFFNDYLENIYDKNTRRVNAKAVIPIDVYLGISLRNKLNIWGYYFTIEEMQYNFLTGETNLNLISSEVTISNLLYESLFDVLEPINIRNAELDNTDPSGGTRWTITNIDTGTNTITFDNPLPVLDGFNNRENDFDYWACFVSYFEAVRIESADYVTNSITYTAAFGNVSVGDDVTFYNPFRSGKFTSVNPLLGTDGTWASTHVTPAGVWQHSDGSYRMFVNGLGSLLTVGIATSTDLESWSYLGSNPLHTSGVAPLNKSWMATGGVFSVSNPVKIIGSDDYYILFTIKSTSGLWETVVCTMDEDGAILTVSDNPIAIPSHANTYGNYAGAITYFNGTYKIFVINRAATLVDWTLYEMDIDTPLNGTTSNVVFVAKGSGDNTWLGSHVDTCGVLVYNEELYVFVGGTGYIDTTEIWSDNRQYGIFTKESGVWIDYKSNPILSNPIIGEYIWDSNLHWASDHVGGYFGGIVLATDLYLFLSMNAGTNTYKVGGYKFNLLK